MISKYDAPTADKAQLIEYCHKVLGHEVSWLKIQSFAKLREYIAQNRNYQSTYAPTTSEPVPDPATPRVETQPATVPTSGKGVAALIDAISEDVAGIVTDRLRPEFLKLLEDRPREVTLNVSVDDQVRQIELGIVHHAQAELISNLYARLNVYIHGGAGGGKTKAGSIAARALGEMLKIDLPFYAFSAYETMQAHELLGYRNALNGDAIRTMLREGYEHGGVVLLDEMDAISATGMVTLNMLLDSDRAQFSGEMVNRSDNFFFIGAGNTLLTGHDLQYNGRQRLDAASRSRFFFMEWIYDEALELAVAGTDQRAWVTHVQKIRKAIANLGASAPELLITPRASIMGARKLRAIPGTTFANLEEGLIWVGCSQDDRAKVRAELGRM